MTYEDMRIRRGFATRYRPGTKALQAQKAVGALGASNTVNSELKVWSSDQDIDAPSQTIPGSQRTYNDPGGKLAEAGRVERGANEWGPKGQPTASEQLKVGSGPTLSQGLGAAASVLNTLDMLTGGQDKILPGSGHTYSHRYNPDMYIGQGMGYQVMERRWNYDDKKGWTQESYLDQASRVWITGENSILNRGAKWLQTQRERPKSRFEQTLIDASDRFYEAAQIGPMEDHAIEQTTEGMTNLSRRLGASELQSQLAGASAGFLVGMIIPGPGEVKGLVNLNKIRRMAKSAKTFNQGADGVYNISKSQKNTLKAKLVEEVAANKGSKRGIKHHAIVDENGEKVHRFLRWNGPKGADRSILKHWSLSKVSAQAKAAADRAIGELGPLSHKEFRPWARKLGYTNKQINAYAEYVEKSVKAYEKEMLDVNKILRRKGTPREELTTLAHNQAIKKGGIHATSNIDFEQLSKNVADGADSSKNIASKIATGVPHYSDKLKNWKADFINYFDHKSRGGSGVLPQRNETARHIELMIERAGAEGGSEAVDDLLELLDL